MRRAELLELSLHELVSRLVHADFVERSLRRELAEVRNENVALRSALAGAMCGHLAGTSSCQLARHHDGMHQWHSPDSDIVIRW